MKEDLLKEIIESNMSANTKVEVIKLLGEKEKNFVSYPYVIEKTIPQRNWWDNPYYCI